LESAHKPENDPISKISAIYGIFIFKSEGANWDYQLAPSFSDSFMSYL